MEIWLQKARGIAEEAAKRSQDLTKEATRLSWEISPETARRSWEFFVVEATKTADQIKAEAVKRADQIKTLAEDSIPSLSETSPPALADLEKYGVTDDLREFAKSLSSDTFLNFPIDDDEPKASDVRTVSNVRQDLTEWQAKHATLVLSTVKEISRLRYELCPCHMRERRFWRIYFILVKSHIAQYEEAATPEAKLRSMEQDKNVGFQETLPAGLPSKPELLPRLQQSKSIRDHDLDVFLLGDLGSSDEEPDNGVSGLDDDDLDKIVKAT